MKKIRIISCLLFILSLSLYGQHSTYRQVSTRPPEDNDRTLRELTPEEIPPNLNFYAIDPLYNPDAVLGWSDTRIEEKLDRGLTAVVLQNGNVYLSWRLLKEDHANIAFNLYRQEKNREVLLNKTPVSKTTDFTVDTSQKNKATYLLKPVVGGKETGETASVTVDPGQNGLYRSIALRDVESVDRVAVADLNGDGAYDFLVKHPRQTVDPGRNRPSQDTYKIDAYDGKSGKFMWRIDLGWNINQGIWFSPMVARDLDGDNKAEVCLRTAPYAATREEAIGGGDSFVIEGPEYLSVYDGETGKEIDKVDWIERGKVQDWGDNTGNRSLRHMLGIAYLDGKTRLCWWCAAPTE